MLSHELRNPLSPLRNAVAHAHAGRDAGSEDHLVARRHRAAAQAHDPAGRRSARRVAHRARQDRAGLRAGERGARSSPRRWKPCSRCSSRRASTCTVECRRRELCGARRPGASRAGRRQSAAQRRQVHGRGRTHRARDALAARARPRSRARHRHRHLRRSPCRTSSSCSRRFRASASTRGGGLGIGLALVRALVELHGGEIVRHQRRASTSGSEFTVRLPLFARTRDAAADGRAGESSRDRCSRCGAIS